MQLSNQDLSHCDKEPIPGSGMVQPFGALLVMRSTDLKIMQASVNVECVLGMSAKAVLGRPLSDIIGPASCGLLTAAIAHAQLHTVSPSIVNIATSARACHVTYNHIDHILIAKFEPASDKPPLPQAREQLPQSQTMHAFGPDNRTIAHEFNNLLATLAINLDIMGVVLKQGRFDDLRRYVTAASKATAHAAALMHQLATDSASNE